MAARDDLQTRKMEALDLTLLTDATAQRDRPTAKMDRREMLELVARSDDLFEYETATPFLRVITTPPEMRAQWENWRWVRRELLVSLVIVAVLTALILFL